MRVTDYQEGDIVIRVKGDFIGELATVVGVRASAVDIRFHNEGIRGTKTFGADPNYIALVSRTDEMLID